MDHAGHRAVPELQKELNQSRRKSFEKAGSVNLTVSTEGKSDISVKDNKGKVTHLEVRQMMEDVNEEDPKVEEEKE